MKKIEENPVRFYPIEKITRNIYAQLIVELLAKDINEKTGGSLNNFYSMRCGEKTIRFAATQCTPLNDKKVQLSGEVIVIDSSRNPARHYHCSNAIFYIEGDEFAHTLTMELYNAKWKSPEGIDALDRRPYIYGLLVPDSITSILESQINNEDFQIQRDVMKIIRPKSISSLISEPQTNLLEFGKNLDRLIGKTLLLNRSLNAE